MQTELPARPWGMKAVVGLEAFLGALFIWFADLMFSFMGGSGPNGPPPWVLFAGLGGFALGFGLVLAIGAYHLWRGKAFARVLLIGANGALLLWNLVGIASGHIGRNLAPTVIITAVVVLLCTNQVRDFCRRTTGPTPSDTIGDGQRTRPRGVTLFIAVTALLVVLCGATLLVNAVFGYPWVHAPSLPVFRKLVWASPLVGLPVLAAVGALCYGLWRGVDWSRLALACLLFINVVFSLGDLMHLALIDALIGMAYSVWFLRVLLGREAERFCRASAT